MKQTDLTAQAIIDLHTASDYLVYMMGFVPGFAYLGKLNTQLFCTRKAVPRRAVPTGAVAIAAAQTAIYPFSTPGGWQILGNTPIPVADLSKPELSLFSIGDKVRFESISLTKYHQIIQSIKRNTFDWEQLYV
jgi:inhibitor of KinA